MSLKDNYIEETYMYMEDSEILIAASNLAAATSRQRSVSPKDLVDETMRIFKMLKAEIEKI